MFNATNFSRYLDGLLVCRTKYPYPCKTYSLATGGNWDAIEDLPGGHAGRPGIVAIQGTVWFIGGNKGNTSKDRL